MEIKEKIVLNATLQDDLIDIIKELKNEDLANKFENIEKGIDKIRLLIKQIKESHGRRSALGDQQEVSEDHDVSIVK